MICPIQPDSTHEGGIGDLVVADIVDLQPTGGRVRRDCCRQPLGEPVPGGAQNRSYPMQNLQWVDLIGKCVLLLANDDNCWVSVIRTYLKIAACCRSDINVE